MRLTRQGASKSKGDSAGWRPDVDRCIYRLHVKRLRISRTQGENVFVGNPVQGARRA